MSHVNSFTNGRHGPGQNCFSQLDSDGCYDSLHGHGIASYDSGLGLAYESTTSLQQDGVSNTRAVTQKTEQMHDDDLTKSFLQMDLASVVEEPCGISLMQKGPVASPCNEIFSQDEDGDTQLHLAIIQPNEEIALWFISAAPVPDYLNMQNNKFWHTPLHLAVITNQPRIVRSLVVHGASLTMRDHQGNTPMHIACSRGLLDCLKKLTAPLNIEEREVMYQLNCSRSLQNIQSLDMTIKNYEGETCLHVAQSSPSTTKLDIISYLLTACTVDINMQEGKCGYTILHQAIKAKHVELIRFLLYQPRLDVNVRCYNGSTALSIAKSLRLSDVIQWLGLLFAIDPQIPEERESSDSDDEPMNIFADLTIAGQS